MILDLFKNFPVYFRMPFHSKQEHDHAKDTEDNICHYRTQAVQHNREQLRYHVGRQPKRKGRNG